MGLAGRAQQGIGCGVGDEQGSTGGRGCLGRMEDDRELEVSFPHGRWPVPNPSSPSYESGLTCQSTN